MLGRLLELSWDEHEGRGREGYGSLVAMGGDTIREAEGVGEANFADF